MTTPNFPNTGLIQILRGGGCHTPQYPPSLCGPGHKLGDFILKRKERRDACRETKGKSNVKMWISSIAKSGDLIANLKRV